MSGQHSHYKPLIMTGTTGSRKLLASGLLATLCLFGKAVGLTVTSKYTRAVQGKENSSISVPEPGFVVFCRENCQIYYGEQIILEDFKTDSFHCPSKTGLRNVCHLNFTQAQHVIEAVEKKRDELFMTRNHWNTEANQTENRTLVASTPRLALAKREAFFN